MRTGRRTPRAPGRLRTLGGAAVAVAVVVGAGTACSSLPTSGPVMDGGGGDDRREFVVAPPGPSPGVGPRALAYGFLGAGLDARDGFAAARSYLTTGSGARWRPGQRVLVHRRAGLEVVLSQGGQVLPEDAAVDPVAGPVTVTVRAPLVAVVDAHGRYRAAAPGEPAQEELTAVREDGQWRLGSAPDQLLVDEADFSLGWGARSLYFPDPAGKVLVPEVRWFPQSREALPAAVATELLRGPSPWLAPAVRRPLVPRPRLSSTSVVVESGTARVDLAEGVLGADTQDRGLLVVSLNVTLGALPTVSTVEVTAGGGRLSGSTPGPPPQASPAVDTRPVLLRDGVPVRPDPASGALEPLPVRRGDDVVGDLSDPAVPADPAAPGAPFLAALAGRDGARTTLVRWEGAGVGRAVLRADAPTSLTAPAVDPAGWLWSATTPSEGTVAVVGRGGRVDAVAAPWLAGRRVVAVRPSREGARALVVSSGPDRTGDRVDVVGVRRDPGGQPRALVEPDPAPVPQVVGVVAAAWVDQSTVAVLGTATSPDPDAPTSPDGGPAPRQVFTVTGGLVQPESAPGLFERREGDAPPPKVVSMAAGGGILYLGTADAQVFQRAGVRWISIPALVGTTDPSFPG